MATVNLDGTNYNVYADQAYADLYLIADAGRFATWAALDDDTKARNLISATRVLQTRVVWKVGEAPDTEDSELSDAVRDAVSALAGEIAGSADAAASPGTSSNVKRAEAGPAKVEFFYQSPSSALPLPEDIWAILFSAGLVGDDSVTNAPFYSGGCQESRFDIGDD